MVELHQEKEATCTCHAQEAARDKDGYEKGVGAGGGGGFDTGNTTRQWARVWTIGRITWQGFGLTENTELLVVVHVVVIFLVVVVFVVVGHPIHYLLATSTPKRLRPGVTDWPQTTVRTATDVPLLFPDLFFFLFVSLIWLLFRFFVFVEL